MVEYGEGYGGIWWNMVRDMVEYGGIWWNMVRNMVGYGGIW